LNMSGQVFSDNYEFVDEKTQNPVINRINV